MDKSEFTNLLHLASDKARDFAEEFVTNHLPNSYRYQLNINEPYSADELQEDEQCFPEEAMPYNELTEPMTSDEVVSRLWKNEKVPVWIDISAYRADDDFTYMELLCCSRHSALKKLYYYEANGTGPFGIKSPVFPPEWQIEKDGKFDLDLRQKLIEDFRNEGSQLPRWIQVPVGVLLGLITIMCLVGSATLVFSPNEKAPILAPTLGVVWIVASCWIIEKCFRLITGKKNRGGLMSPQTLRGVGWFFLLLPLCGLFTGYFITHTTVAVVQTLAYISIFFGLRKLAASRET